MSQIRYHMTPFFLLTAISLWLIGYFCIPVAQAGPREEIRTRILTLFPPYAGKVREIQGSTIVIQGSSAPEVQSGAYLLVNATGTEPRTPAGTALVRVLSVDGRELRAEPLGQKKIAQGDQVIGSPRPLTVALMPMSRPTLEFLLQHPLSGGDLVAVRTEDVLTAMMQQGFEDFSDLENTDVSALASALKTPLVVQAKLRSGFGKDVLQLMPHWSQTDERPKASSVLLPSRTGSAAEPPTADSPPAIRGAGPSVSTLTPSPQQGVTPVLPGGQTPATAKAHSPRSVTPQGAVSRASLPKLPSAADFSDPRRWVRILELKERIISMAGGSFTATGKRELAIASPGTIRIYAYRESALRAGESLQHPDLSALFWLEAWDVNGDGVDEILVDTDTGVVLLTQRDGRLQVAHRQQGLAIRRIGGRLFGQTLSGPGTAVHPVRWNGKDWELGEAPAPLESMSLFSVVDAFSDPPLFIGPDHKLTHGHQPISEKTFGQSNTTELLQLEFPVFARSLASPQGALLLTNRPVGWPRLKKDKYSNGGGVAIYAPSGSTVSSPLFRGYIADVSLCDLDGDGNGEILISQVDSGVFSGRAYILRYH